jgi:hypothetical protein
MLRQMYLGHQYYIYGELAERVLNKIGQAKKGRRSDKFCRINLLFENGKLNLNKHNLIHL